MTFPHPMSLRCVLYERRRREKIFALGEFVRSVVQLNFIRRERKMKSKWFVVFSVIVFASLVLSACGGAGGVAGGPLQSIGDGEGEVSIISWAGYIERGETDPAYDWVTEFEKNTSCKVTNKTAATSDEMVALMNEGGFDLVTASGDASNRLITGGRVQEINTALIPSWNKVDSRLQSAAWNTVGDKHYGVPYQWGPNVLAYNTEVFGDQPPTSWNVVFEEQ